MKQVPASFLTLIVGVVVTLISLWVGKTQHLLPEQVSEQAILVDNFFSAMVVIGVAIFLIVEGALLFFVIRFRQRPGDEGDGSPIEGNIPLEIVWTAIPSIIVVALGIYSVSVYSEMGGFDPVGHPMMAHHHPSTPREGLMGSAIAAPLSEADEMDMAEAENMEGMDLAYTYGLGAAPGEEAVDLVVNVTGVQYAWIFNYPDQGIYAAELHIAVNQNVQLNLEASDVIHSFWLPQFRLKQDAIPGQKSQLRFKAIKTGTYPIVCAELCGAFHGTMRTQVVIHEPEEFEVWVAANRLAQQVELDQAIALNLTHNPTHNPTDTLSNAEYLAPYGEEMGINSGILTQAQGGNPI